MAEVNVHHRASPKGLSLRRNKELGFKVTWSLEGKPTQLGEDCEYKRQRYSVHPSPSVCNDLQLLLLA
jgi:hypothetical protein